jgi:hypothetical protein
MLFQMRGRNPSWLPWVTGMGLLACIVAGFISVFVNLKETSIGDARLAFVGLVGFVIVLTNGTAQLVQSLRPSARDVGLFVWPVMFVAVDVFVLARFMIPLVGWI